MKHVIFFFLLLTVTFNSLGQTSWILAGNGNTNPATNYIGTSDNKNVVFKRFAKKSGLISDSTTSFGYESLNGASLAGIYNVAFGTRTLFVTSTGSRNTAIGYQSLRNNTIGSDNAALGLNSLFSNNSGTSNTGVGASSLVSNTSGSYNTAVGFNSLYYNTLGGFNTAIGSSCMQSNQTGQYNSALGHNALASNTNGEYNSAFGFYSLHYNAGGHFNTAVGSRSLQSNSLGNRNSSFGYNALTANTLGSYNTAIGFESLVNNQSGNYNTIIGYNTGNGIISGSKNTIIGANVTGLTSALSNSIILADGDGNQRIFVNQDGNVGVGITSLTTGIKLNVNGNIFTNQKILINSDITHAGNFSLAVNGEAIFNRAVVRLYGSWPDYVFDETYKPESLEEVEKYVKENKHLKGMKSASEIAEEGIDLGENQKKMLEKIEELTLYIIEQNKAINNLQKEVDILKKNTKQ